MIYIKEVPTTQFQTDQLYKMEKGFDVILDLPELVTDQSLSVGE